MGILPFGLLAGYLVLLVRVLDRAVILSDLLRRQSARENAYLLHHAARVGR
jgi:hypothetical protein